MANNSLGRVRLQDIREFTVQIRNLESNEIVGTGIIISSSCHVVTCAHVVVEAGINPRTGSKLPNFFEYLWKNMLRKELGTTLENTKGDIGVYFPQIQDSGLRLRKAKIIRYFQDYDDDIVLLGLQGDPPLLNPNQVAVIGNAEFSGNNLFRSYGYRRLGNYIAAWADGKILGKVEPPTDRVFLEEPIQLICDKIDAGMSGAAVLDIDRNLVVGIISEAWFPDLSSKASDTAWAINAKILNLEPFAIPLRDTFLEKGLTPQPQIDVKKAHSAALLSPGIALYGAPSPLSEWVGRTELLKNIQNDWKNNQVRIVGLIGIGGEGKSSLARHWVDETIRDDIQEKPEGVFWWGFYENSSIDEFFDTAIQFLTAGKLDPQDYPSIFAKAHLVAAMLTKGRYLFILDGIELFQYKDGDLYGLLKSGALREFLEFFASPGHNSFCIVTSRLPLIDLIKYSSYNQVEVKPLLPFEGRSLLRKLGVKGPDSQLNHLVNSWDNHALALSLIGSYIVEKYAGNSLEFEEYPFLQADNPVQRLLSRYDQYMSETEKIFLTLFAAFRIPLSEPGLFSIFRNEESKCGLLDQFFRMGSDSFEKLIRKLCDYRILRHNTEAENYSCHPLIHEYYDHLLMQLDNTEISIFHSEIMDYYLSHFETATVPNTLNDLNPVIEATHHCCSAGRYDEAFIILRDKIHHEDEHIINQKFAAWETALAINLEFFPNDYMKLDPLVTDIEHKSLLINEVGLCFMNLGKLAESLPFFKRASEISISIENSHDASHDFMNLSELYADIGDLRSSLQMAEKALTFALKAGDKRDECDARCRHATSAFLLGDVRTAEEEYKKSESLQRELLPNRPFLFGLRGIQYGYFLLKSNNHDLARQVTETNLLLCEQNKAFRSIIQCHQLLGYLDMLENRDDQSSAHLETALNLARSRENRHLIIKSLILMGQYFAKKGEVLQAVTNLNEAINYISIGGYQVDEIDIRNSLASIYIGIGEINRASLELDITGRMSGHLGYKWGSLDFEVLHGKLEQLKDMHNNAIEESNDM
jgi:tetratricopeptide (TPR) repeat protein